MKKHSEKFLRKRRFLMVLPVMVLPFTSMFFWALGGGAGLSPKAKAEALPGLNVGLPDAQFGEGEVWDKLSLYELADRDSAKYEEARESDPYFDLMAFESSQSQHHTQEEEESNLISAFRKRDIMSMDANEERVNNKLQELYEELDRQAGGEVTSTNQLVDYTSADPYGSSSHNDPQFTSDIDRLERMMEMMQEGGTSNEEMEEIDIVLDKILDVQHPERVARRLEDAQTAQASYSNTVKLMPANDHISLIGSEENPQVDTIERGNNAFLGVGPDRLSKLPEDGAIEAVVHTTQELVTGATVKLRIRKTVEINQVVVPADQFVFGTCAINGERITVKVSSIRVGNQLLPVSLSVYDIDGLEGIYIPGAISRDVAKQASGDAMQNFQFMSLNPSIGTQAAAAGVDAVKGLFTRKAKLVKCTVKAGYRVFLVDKNPRSVESESTAGASR